MVPISIFLLTNIPHTLTPLIAKRSALASNLVLGAFLALSNFIYAVLSFLRRMSFSVRLPPTISKSRSLYSIV
ncbi:Uncharacterised protein [Mycobacterium tuberculosis]|nr:Uncharacterised protein [Mycobacterium tuberculosis]